MHKITMSGVVSVSLALVPVSVSADESGQLTLGLGAFDAFDTDELSAEGLAEYRFGKRMFEDNFGPRFQGLGPMVGIRANTDGGVTGYGSIFADIRPYDRWYIWPSAGIAGYSEDDSRDLGGVFQFHLGVAAGYRLTERTRIGIAYQHVSNASIHDQNPGADSLFLTVTFELSPLD